MPPKQKITFYTCPHCGEKQTTAIEWHQISVGYYRGINGKKIEKEEVYSDNSEYEDHTCPNCSEILPRKITNLFPLV